MEEKTTELPNNENIREFLSKLSESINQALNPTGEKKIGFSMFVYDATGKTAHATLVSNLPPDRTDPIASKWLQLQRKKKRRAGPSELKAVK